MTTIDSQFEDPDSGYFAIWISEIDLNTGNALTEARLFHVSSLPLNTPRLAEGGHIYKLGKYYYLLTAEAGTGDGHRAMISRAKSLNGPWETNPNNPILFNGMPHLYDNLWGLATADTPIQAATRQIRYWPPVTLISSVLRTGIGMRCSLPPVPRIRRTEQERTNSAVKHSFHL